MLKKEEQYSYNFIDLFAGAGGLSEGFLQAGFKPVAHVEMNEFAAKTLETRSAYYYLKGTDNLGLYKKYLTGKISRDEFMKQISYTINIQHLLSLVKLLNPRRIHRNVRL